MTLNNVFSTLKWKIISHTNPFSALQVKSCKTKAMSPALTYYLIPPTDDQMYSETEISPVYVLNYVDI